MNQKVRFGLVGLGNISSSQHLPNLSRANHIDFRAICDLKEDLLKKYQNKYEVPKAYNNFNDLVSDPEIEAVLIATRAEDHLALTIQALEAGKHVYVEKPLAETSHECAKVVQAQRKSGKMLVVGFNRRMAPAYVDAKEIIQKHGGAKNIHYRLADAYHLWGPASNFAPGTRILHEVGHIFDILRYFCECEVETAYCVCSRPDDDCIVLTFESGAVASIMSSGYVQFDMPKECLEVVVELGALIVNDFVELRTFGLDDCPSQKCYKGHIHPDKDTSHRYLFESHIGYETMLNLRKAYYKAHFALEKLKNVDTPERWELQTDYEYHLPYINYMMNKGWLESLEHFARAILGLERLKLATAEDGLAVSLITEAAMASRQTGQPVRVKRASDLLNKTNYIFNAK